MFGIFIFLAMMIAGGEFVTKDCPVGERVALVNDLCPDNAYFLFNDWVDYCCCEDKTPCLSTGMISQYSYDNRGQQMIYRRHSGNGGWYQSGTPNTYFAYEYNTTDRDWLCPVPVGYLWINIYKLELTQPYQKQFLPVDFTDMEHVDDRLKTCTMNSECGDQEFCGDVINASFDPETGGKCSDDKFCNLSADCGGERCYIDKTIQTWADKQHKFCYKVPPIPVANAPKMQFAMSSTTSNLVFCDQDNDCDINNNKGEYCHTTLERNGQKWTSYEPHPDPTKIGYRKNYDGLCMNAKPISFLFSDLFDGLSDQDKTDTSAQKYFPVDMKHDDYYYLEKLDKCDKNSQCGEGSFCGESISLLESKSFVAKDRKYCYKGPEGLPANYRYVIVPDKISLIPCDTDGDCSAGVCHIYGSPRFAKLLDTGTRQSFKGLCIEEESSSLVIWIIVIVSLILLVIVIAAVVFFVLRKLKASKTMSSKSSEKTDKIIASPTTPGTTTPVSQNAV